MSLRLQGIFPAITTPFDHTGEIYAAKMRHNIEKWNRTGLAGYVVLGSTGEAVMLNAAERARTLELAAASAAPGKILIAGTGAESVRSTLAHTAAAASLGYKAALVLTPHYYKGSFTRPEAQMLFYRAVADQSALPILIYTFPQVTGLDIAVETVAALSEHPNIIGIKDSSGNVEKLMRLVNETQPGFQVLSGSAGALWPSLYVGASGGILAYANAAPYSCIAIWEAHLKREEEAGRDWQQRISRAARLVTATYGIAGLKHAMDLNGYYGGPPRLPLSVPSQEAMREIEEAFQDLKG